MRLVIDLVSQVDGGPVQLRLDCTQLTVESVVGELRLQVLLPTSMDSLSTRLLAVSRLAHDRARDCTLRLAKPLLTGG